MNIDDEEFLSEYIFVFFGLLKVIGTFSSLLEFFLNSLEVPFSVRARAEFYDTHKFALFADGTDE